MAGPSGPRLRRFKRPCALLATLAVFCLTGATAARDITPLVLRHSDLAQRIRRACDEYCQGNRREGRLRQVTIVPLGAGRHAVRATATLQNRDEFASGLGDFVLYDYTIEVEARGTLRSEDCALTIESVRFAEDPLGLGALAQQLEGHTEPVPNCDVFVR